MSWYDDWQMEDGTPILAAIALWLFIAAVFVLGLCFAGWYFHTAWANTVYITGGILSALSVTFSLVQRVISKYGHGRVEED